jgi:hypothetical protein
MNFAAVSLVEVAAAVGTHLLSYGIYVVVVGGNAITSHVFRCIYVHGCRLCCHVGERRTIVRVLRDVSFRQQRRVFVHPETA